jgi:isopentenyldiphosphate isomerase
MAVRIRGNEFPASPAVSPADPSLSPEEEVAIVDESNTVIGSAPRSDMRKRGLIHRATYVFVFDTKGRLFVQERTLTKDIFPGHRDLCTGGVVLSGEDYEKSAVRELGEEIGLTSAELTFHFDFYGEYAGQKVWGRVFSCISDGPFVLQPEEVAGGAFYSIDEVQRLIGEKSCTPDSVYAFMRFLEMNNGSQAFGGRGSEGEVD